MSDDQLEELEADVVTPEPKKPAPPKAKTGWCLTNDHRRCPVRFGKLECMCNCEDHGVDYVRTAEPQISELMRSILDKYRL